MKFKLVRYKSDEIITEMCGQLTSVTMNASSKKKAKNIS